MFEPEVECKPRHELKALQLGRLKETLARVWHQVPHYRRLFEDAGVTPDDLAALEDLPRFPFTRKDDLRQTYPFGMFALPRQEVRRLHASSGTTGKPTVVGYSEGDLETWAGLMARSMACAGVRPGDVVHNAYGYGLFTGGLGFHDGAQRLGCTVVPISGGNTRRQIMLLQDFKANVLAATPSYALNIAEVAASEGVDLRNGGLRTGMFGAEPWGPAMRRELERGLGLRAVNIYGLSEIIGPGVACECAEARDGMHGWEDHFLFEVIDARSGEPVAEDVEGELVITTLTKEALPLLRYRTGDLTRLLPEPCVCGRGHVRIAAIVGRGDDMLIIRGVNVFPSQVEAVLTDFSDLAPHYQLLVARHGAMDSLTIEVEAVPSVAPGDFERIGQAAGRHIDSAIGLKCAVAVKAPGELPRSEGKAVRVRDLREASR